MLTYRNGSTAVSGPFFFYAFRMRYLWIASTVIGLAIVGVVCLKALSGPLNADFTMFWKLHELAYPPPYLLFIKPFTLLPYGAAFILWVGLTGALYVFASREAKLPALGNPAAAFNGMIGQNGFLTGAIMFAGLQRLAVKPWQGGALLGLLIIKPHLAIILPVAVVAGRAWQAVPAALGSMVLLLLLSFAVFGADAYVQFFELSARYGTYVKEGAWDWNELASFYALSRWAGLPTAGAWIVHLLLAVAAATGVWFAWRQDWEAKVALTSAAALLMSPYLFTYDAVLLTLALGCLHWPGALAVAALLFIPLARVFTHQDWPNTVPVAAALAVCLIARASWPRTSWSPTAVSPA